tara:strand:+ start:2622 stop:3524 length:903 start_codon:yes stop_codon:yes gene_type:complete
MNESWIPMNVQWWLDIAATISKPWPPQAVWLDLRYWKDQEGMGRAKRPSRRRLGERWGWTDYKTREALKAEQVWGSPTKSQRDPKEIPKGSQTNPKIDSQTPVTTETDHPTKSQEDPKLIPKGSPRAELHTTHNTQQTNSITSDKTKDLWEEIMAERAKAFKGVRYLKLTPSRRSMLAARVREHSREEVMGVVRWWLYSKHDRADYIRKNHTIGTVLRPSNFPTYLEFSTQLEVVKTPHLYAEPKAPAEELGIDTFPKAIVEKVTFDLDYMKEILTPDQFVRAVTVELNKRRDHLKVVNQ